MLEVLSAMLPVIWRCVRLNLLVCWCHSRDQIEHRSGWIVYESVMLEVSSAVLPVPAATATKL